MRFTGIVVKGNQIGRKLGFPTANIQFTDPAESERIPSGVFACRVFLQDGTVYGGMLNVGTRPTVVADQACPKTVEVHLFDFTGNLYGAELGVEIVEKLREERRFSGLEALKEQLEKDKAEVLSLLSRC